MLSRATLFVLIGLLMTTSAAPAATVLVEAEGFADHGGWSLDTQFIREMGSPYLMAHGLGKPVADATTSVAIPSPGTYRVFVRTKDWVARWNAPGTFEEFEDAKKEAVVRAEPNVDLVLHTHAFAVARGRAAGFSATSCSRRTTS